MRNPILQLLLILALAGAAGAAYNFSNIKNPEKYLPWDCARFYPDRPVDGKSPPVEVAPDKTPSVSRPSVEAGASVPEKTVPPVAPVPTANPTVKQDSPQTSTPASPFPLIKLKQTLEELDGGTTFVDARRTREYEEGHIPGAISICPYEQADLIEKVNKLREGAVLEAPVVVYCTNAGECESSKLTAGHLKDAGFLNLLIYEGGFPEWKKEKADKIAVGKEPGKWAP